MEKEYCILGIELTVRKYPIADPPPFKRFFYDLFNRYDLVQEEIRRYEDIDLKRCIKRYEEEYPNEVDRRGHILKCRGAPSPYRPRKTKTSPKKEIKVKALSIYINLDNDAFVKDQAAELKRIFTDLANLSGPNFEEAKQDGIRILDAKGEQVGRMRVITDERKPDL
ncbi:MAG TPA: hypothetical protein DET40_04905 [Lentisphaeria bacterium]|nr:MAG: hypothetical protein A2X45_13480 [Lentisphaerae bacterium GWF2_50_93]HCE42865.1 hypothetical protein [Lentisphaeria bacterium]